LYVCQNSSVSWCPQGAKARLRKAEQALEVVLDAQLGFRRENNDSSEDDDASSFGFPANFKDDYVDSDAEASSSEGDSSPNRAAAVGGIVQARGCQSDFKSNKAYDDAGHCFLLLLEQYSAELEID